VGGWHLVWTTIGTAIASGTAVLIVSSGELLVERLGVYNIGLEGVMLVGALTSFIVGNESGNLAAALLAGMAAGAAFSAVAGLAITVFGADMIMAGLALWFVGLGVTGELGTDYVLQPAAARLPFVNIGGLGDIPVTAFVAVVLPFAAYALLNHTRHGLTMRAIGEDPVASDVAGIRVNAWRMFYVAVGGALAGLGGASLSLATVATWIQGISAGQGWIALAIVIFAGWRPLGLLFGAFLFGLLGALGDVAQAEGWGITSQFFSALPYAGTFLVLVLLTWYRSRKTGRTPWPASLGRAFMRGVQE
jgi:ABC-type uncharacterized transport system permease subunit